jgi:catechol-2,3-dioxygenase
MPSLGVRDIHITVPDLEPGIRFYRCAGLEVSRSDNQARFRCPGEKHDAVVLTGGAERKKLHHITLRCDADGLERATARVMASGGRIITPPGGLDTDGLWIEDPHGLAVHLVLDGPQAPLTAAEPFQINMPGRIVRANVAAIRAKSTIAAIKPRRLGHVLLFTPDVLRSIDFYTNALGMCLADRSADVIAFLCCYRNSDHHVLAFAKSPGIGLHHISLQVDTPDEVGLAGRRLIAQGYPGNWGFGRHTIGSNFFHYIQDPWGSWFEYFSDMDVIDDYSQWTPRNYPLEDSLENWGPALPGDFVHNYEVQK